MKKITAILACMLVCFLLFTGCTNLKDGSDQDTNVGNSVEIDDTDIAIDTEPGLDTEDNSGDVTLPDGFTYSRHAEGVARTGFKKDFQEQNHDGLKFCS